MTYPAYPANTPNGAPTTWNKTGTIDKDTQYDVPISTTGILPPGTLYINMVVSVGGGNLVYQGNDGLVYQFVMAPGVEYPLVLFNGNSLVNNGVSSAQFLSGLKGYVNRAGLPYTNRTVEQYESRADIVDWQGNPAVNSVDDLEYRAV